MFRRFKTIVLSAAIVAVLGTVAADAAETKFKFDGQVRFRTEGSQRSFDPDATMREYNLLRTRLALGATVDDYTNVYVQLQDSRLLGGRDAFGNPNSGSLNDAKNVDLHQAYIKLNRIFNDHWGFQAGRFEVNLGNQRVFGAVGWSNIGRAWEGANGWFQNDAVQATGYWLKRLERDLSYASSDFNVYGVNAKVKKTGAEVFGFYERDANTNLVEDVENDINALSRMSVGAYFKRVFGGVDLEANGVYQFGTQADADSATVSEQDISAYLLTAEAGMVFFEEKKTRVALGLDWASGDDDPTDDTFGAYNNLYYTGHKFRGRMDYFLVSNSQGLIDVMGRGSVAVADGWKILADVHYFRTHKEYTDFNDENTTSVGSEIDMWVSTTRLGSLKLDGGLAMFFPNESFAGRSDAKTGLWGYVMVTGNFGEK